MPKFSFTKTTMKFGKLYIALFVLFIIAVTGILGFMFMEDHTFAEALYMTVITISTVGFGHIKPISELGLYFTSGLIISSFGVFAYVISTLTGYFVEGEFTRYFKERRITKKLRKMKNHVIVVGYGRNGKQAVHDLLQHNELVIMIEKKQLPQETEHEQNPNFIWISGDATNDDVMERAHIKDAKALITALPNDADNLFIVLTARTLNPTFKIISRASEENSDAKLKRAGANSTIMPERVGGTRMAMLIAQPDVVGFIDSFPLKFEGGVHLEEIKCEKLNTNIVGKSIRELEIRHISGANIIGIQNDNDAYIYNPDPGTVLTRKSKIFVMGTEKQLQKMKEILQLS